MEKANPFPNLFFWVQHVNTVDGRNPAPPGILNLVNIGINYIPTGAEFRPSTVCPGCFHNMVSVSSSRVEN